MKDLALAKLWEQRLSEYDCSGKTVSNWCKEHSLTKSQFYYWKNKLNIEILKKEPAIKCLPVDIKDSPNIITETDCISVHYGKLKLEIKKGFDKKLFQEIVKALDAI